MDINKIIDKHSYAIGKIIVMKIIKLIKKNSNLVVGLIIGANVGSLINIIPLIGSLLAPLTIIIGAIYGMFKGHEVDIGDSNSVIFKILSTMAKEFWKLISKIFIVLSKYIIQKPSK